MKHTKANTSKNYKGNACNLRLKALEDNRFDLVRNEERFKKIIADLEKHAEKNLIVTPPIGKILVGGYFHF